MPITRNDHYIIVNYHYVENPRPDFSGIFPCPVKEFERQVAQMSRNFKITTLEGVYEACASHAPEKVAAITFDDGLNDQYENAVPLLKKYGAPASFFIITSTLDGVVPSAHKIHVLLSRVPPDELVRTLNSFMESAHPDLAARFHVPRDRRISKRRMHEDIAVANFKETVSALPIEIKNQYIARVFASMGIEESKLAQELFMDRARIASLHRDGFEIGNHSDSHDALTALGAAEIRHDVRESQRKLHAIVGEAPVSFSYPFGLTSTASLEALEEEKVKYAVTVDARALTHDDHRLLTPRFDTNDMRDGDL